MPDRRIRTGPDKKRTSERLQVMSYFDGRTVLAGDPPNLMPNPDFADSDFRGKLEEYEIVPPIDPDGWWFYYSDPTTPARKDFERYGTRQFQMQRERWILGDTPNRGPDPVKASEALDIITPSPGDVELYALSQLGFPAGTLWVTLAMLVGDRNERPTNLIMTPGCIPVGVVLSLGQGFRVPLPQDREESVAAFILGAAKPGTTSPYYVQDIINVEDRIPLSVPLRGPWRRDLGQIPDVNRTYRGEISNLPAPRKRWKSAGKNRTLKKGRYRLAMAQKTRRGWIKSGDTTNWIDVAKDHKGRAIEVWPGRKARGAIGWRLEVQYTPKSEPDPAAPWYWITKPGGGALPFNWPHEGRGPDITDLSRNDHDHIRIEKAERVGTDSSGIPTPDFTLDEITDDLKFGGAPVTGGKKRIRFSWAKDDRESLPSAYQEITVPTSSGVPTHSLRVHRPPGPNEMKNPRFVNLDQSGALEDWEKLGTGVTHLDSIGKDQITDTGGLATNEVVLREARESLRDLKNRTVKTRMRFTTYTTGLLQMCVRWYDVGLSLIGTEQVISEIFSGEQDRYIKTTLGPPSDPTAEINWPAGARYRQIFFRSVGNSTFGARNFVAIVNELGVQRGDTHGHKRIAVHDDEREEYTTDPGIESDEEDYPFGYAVILDSWRDSPQQNTSAILTPSRDFSREALPLEAPWVEVLSNGTLSLITNRPIHGEQSLEARDTSTTVAGTAFYRANIDSGNRLQRNDRFRFRMPVVPSSGVINLYRVATLNGAEALAYIRATGAGNDNTGTPIYTLSLVHRNASNAETLTTIASRVRAHDDFDIEIDLSGAGSASGSIRCWVSREEARRVQKANITGINWSGRHAQDAAFGIITNTSPVAEQPRIIFDDMMWHDSGSSAWEDIPGRMFEYYAPYGTPLAPRGLRRVFVPVAPNEDYIFSMHHWYRGVTLGQYPFEGRIFNHLGREVGTIDSPAPGKNGRKNWYRPWVYFATPADAAYVVFDSRLSDGLVRHAGLQLDEGRTEEEGPRPFNNTNALSGSFIATFDLRVPGVPSDWRLSEHSRVKDIIAAGYDGDIEEGVTAVGLEYSVCADIESPNWSPWVTDIDDLWVPQTETVGLQVRCTLTTTDATKSPEVTDVWVRFTRYEPVVCAGDGTEYPGGTYAFDAQSVNRGRTTEITYAADGTEHLLSYGVPRDKMTLGIEAYLDEGQDELTEDQGHGPLDDGTFIYESDRDNTRKRLRFINALFEAEARDDVHWGIDTLEVPMYLLRAEGVEASVLDEDELR